MNITCRSKSDAFVFLVKIAFTAVITYELGQFFKITDMLTLLFVTLICLTPTSLGGLRIGLQQLATAVFCSVITMTLMKFTHYDYIIIPLALIISSYYILSRNFDYLLPIVYFSVLYIAIFGRVNPEQFFINRIAHLFIGIPVAVIMNLIFGVYNYKNKLFNSIILVRELLLTKSSEMLQALINGDKKNIEESLDDLGMYYEKLNLIVENIKDIEAEYKSFSTFFISKIESIEEYKHYLWHLHDILQIIHNTLTLSFKLQIDEAEINQLIVLRNYIEKLKIRSIREHIYDEKLADCSGNLFSHFKLILIHINTLIEFEKKLSKNLFK